MPFAELNIARLRYPLDDPRLAEFVDNLGRVNGMAERMPGFICALLATAATTRRSTYAPSPIQ